MLGVVNYAKHIYFDKKNSGIRLLNGAWQTIIHGSLPKENTKGFIIICLDILYKIKESPILKNRVEKSILFFSLMREGRLYGRKNEKEKAVNEQIRDFGQVELEHGKTGSPC